VISPDDMDMKVDYFVPCSSGPAVTRNNASYIKASVICGAANNQLESDDLAELLHGRGIIYVPDL
jgi:glutamate dehydrogenase/leucine dehydrogenase